MSNVERIRNGLFVIRWEKRSSPIISKPKEDIKVVDVIQGYSSCQLEARVERELVVLDMKLIPNEQNKTSEKDLEKVLVVVSYQDMPEVTMKFFKTKWQARWSLPPNLCAKCEMTKTKTKTEVFEIVIDFQVTAFVQNEEVVVDDSVPLNLGRSLLKNKSLADVVFRCGNHFFHAHSLILLSCCSPKLVAMVKWAQSQENRIAGTSDPNINQKHPTKINQAPSVPEKKIVTIDVNPEFVPSIFGQLLAFIYTGQVQFGHDVNTECLFYMANLFGVDSLKIKCLLYFFKNLKVENATCYLYTAERNKDKELMEVTLTFMARNAEAICSHTTWLDFVKSYPELAVEAMKRMVACE